MSVHNWREGRFPKLPTSSGDKVKRLAFSCDCAAPLQFVTMAQELMAEVEHDPFKGSCCSRSKPRSVQGATQRRQRSLPKMILASQVEEGSKDCIGCTAVAPLQVFLGIIVRKRSTAVLTPSLCRIILWDEIPIE